MRIIELGNKYRIYQVHELVRFVDTVADLSLLDRNHLLTVRLFIHLFVTNWFLFILLTHNVFTVALNLKNSN